jgi:plasmid stabilization system protein ParE
LKLRLIQPALDDVREIAAYYDQYGKQLRARFREDLNYALERIEKRPKAFSLLETLPASRGYRRAKLPAFPYLVIYRIKNFDVVVIAVVHTSRRPNFWLGRVEKPP